MQRTRKSAHAPVGTALFLFLGLAILPLSLRATGVQFSFSPRLSAATDAWQQVAEVFGASYRPAPLSALSVVKDLDIGPSNAVETFVSPDGSDLACARKSEELPATQVGVPVASSVKECSVRRSASKSASHRTFRSNQVAMIAAVEPFKTSFEKQAVISAFGALKVATLKRGELLETVDKRLFNPLVEPIVEVRRSSGSRKTMVLFHWKKAVAGSSAQAAERKVFSALASARRRECDRAMLNLTTIASQDHSEF